MPRDVTTRSSHEDRASDSHSVSTKRDPHTVSASQKEGHKPEFASSKVKISLGGGSGSGGLLGKRPAGTITMKLKPQVRLLEV